MKQRIQFAKAFALFTLILYGNVISAQDWSNTKQFKMENSQLSEVKENEKRVVLMGNSITIGWVQTPVSYTHLTLPTKA